MKIPFAGGEAYVFQSFGVKLDERSNEGSQGGCFTGVKNAFDTWDMRRGQSPVVRGIVKGRAEAKEISVHLTGHTNL